MFSLQMSAKGIIFKLEMSLRIPHYITSDRRRLMQVMINLLSNAIKFTNEGSITLECNFDDQKKSIMFQVIDTGIGIRVADQVKLFKMFGKLKNSSKQNQQGIGMGLNVCKRIINVYNGELAVTSELGVGSKFSFSFLVKDFKMEKDPDSENENDNQISLAHDDRTS